MNNRKSSFVFLILLMLCCFLGSAVSVQASKPKTIYLDPPPQNQHPPKTEDDIARVKFAQDVLSQAFIRPSDSQLATLNKTKSDTINPKNINLSSECLKDQQCWQSNLDFLRLKEDNFKKFGSIVEVKHFHIVPWMFQQYQNSLSSSQASQKIKKSEDYSDQNHMMKQAAIAKDEYVVHAYVQFSKSAPGDAPNIWYNVDVILTEDDEKHIIFRRLHFFPLQSEPEQDALPDGVKC